MAEKIEPTPIPYPDNPDKYIEVDGIVLDEAALASVPASRQFRMAWEHVGPALVVNLESAREQVRNELRAVRINYFTPYDLIKQDMSAKSAMAGQLSQTDKDAIQAAEISAQKLRDITQHATLVNATTPEELAVITLDSLLAE